MIEHRRFPRQALFIAPALLLLISLAVGVRSLQGAGVSSAERSGCNAGSGCNLIQHIVIMDKENRSFDSMFGTFPGAHGARTYVDRSGHRFPLTHQPDHLLYDISH